MIETSSEFLKSISDYLIKGIFISILLIIFIKKISKNKIETVLSTKIIKWIIIFYSFGVLLNTILILIFPPTEKYAILERATGPYWWAYWLMISMNSIIPLILLNSKIGRKLYFLLIISLLMNIGWLFESFVVHMTSLHRDFITEDYNPYLPNSREFYILLNGLVLGIILLVIENIINKKRKQNKKFSERKFIQKEYEEIIVDLINTKIKSEKWNEIEVENDSLEYNFNKLSDTGGDGNLRFIKKRTNNIIIQIPYKKGFIEYEIKTEMESTKLKLFFEVEKVTKAQIDKTNRKIKYIDLSFLR